MKTIIFFGAGQIGKRILDLWQQFGLQPDFFMDNSKTCCGKLYYGIPVLPVEELRKLDDIKILITCSQVGEVYRQLLDYGISQEDIFRGTTVIDMLVFWCLYMRHRLQWKDWQDNRDRFQDRTSILFDLPGGFLLGGVESWALETAAVLSKKGMPTKFIMTDTAVIPDEHADKEVVILEYKDEPSQINRLKKGADAIRKNMPCNIICNFISDIFFSACLAKLLWPQKVNLIAVVHNDEELFYEWYGNMREVIDYCLTISSKISDSLLCKGFPESKIEKLGWKIRCSSSCRHIYSEKGQAIRMGYAGRIVIQQKRMDLLMDLARKLDEFEIDFILEIAGNGDYLQTFKEQVEKEKLQQKVRFLGYIPNDRMEGFWSRQDIVVGCSDFEGRSISQAEAMASGAVPVITDTSGARDYVEDGYNGYIVPVGDVNRLADKIDYLYRHKDLLKLMGKRSHQRILRQNEESIKRSIWDKILKK